MKLTIIPKWMLLAGAAMMLVAGGLVGCDDTVKPDEDGAEGPIHLTTIIVNPKSPAPGDTIRLTAVVTSDSPNVGHYPTYVWSAGDGTFLENGQASVRWEAPGSSTLLTVSVTVSSSVNKVSSSATIFVGEPEPVLAGNAGQVFLTGATKDDFFYYQTDDPGLGFEFYRYSNGVTADAADAGKGAGLVISRSLTSAACQRDVMPNNNLIEPVNVYYTDLVAGTETKITADKADPESVRRQRFSRPALSNDGSLLAYQGLRPAFFAGNVDSVDIFVYNPATMATVAVTETHGIVRRNHAPTFSTDGKWLLFASNRAAAGKPALWEYYGLPVSGTVVDTAMAQTVRITDSNSQIFKVAATTVTTVTPPVMSWNPVNPILALVMTNGWLMQVTLDSQGGISATTPLQSAPRELVWSSDGSMLAFTNGSALHTAPAGGTGATLVHEAGASEVINDIVWSPDRSVLVYRITRGSGSWFELKPVGNPAVAPIVLTSIVPAGDMGPYRRLMSMSPLWLPGDELLLLQFHGATPGIDLLDITAALE